MQDSFDCDNQTMLGRSACDALFSNSLCLEGLFFLVAGHCSMMFSAANEKHIICLHELPRAHISFSFYLYCLLAYEVRAA